MMSRKNIIISLSVVAILLIGVTLFLFFSAPDDQKSQYTANDNGYQIAIDNNLMIPVNITFDNLNVKIMNVYFDGLRVYVDVCVPEETKITVAQAMLSDTHNNERFADHIYSTGNDITVLIWDNYSGGSEVTLQLVTSENSTVTSPLFNIGDNQATIIQDENYHEEIMLHTIAIGKTSTLINMDIYTLLDISDFQIEIDGEIKSSVMDNVNSSYYTVLFPIIIDIDQTFIIYALDSSENIVFTIPVNLETTE